MRRALAGLAVVSALVLAAACSSSSSPSSSSTSSPTSTGASSAQPTTTVSASGAITNTWTGAPTDPTKVPIGDDGASTSAPGQGKAFVCQAGNPAIGGASKDGPWIHGDTYDATAKVRVQGSVSWPTATFTMNVAGGTRTITTNDLPDKQVTGTFPIAASDPAHEYDQNPNRIAEHATTLTLPASPTAASSPGCLSGGPIGILLNGVLFFDALDGPGRDAVAHETQDVCDGHPAPGNQYHYHDIPSCLRDAATGASTVVGFANDGYPIVVERDASGNLPTNVDLDECHGRTSPVTVDGAAVTTYHYDATLEYPYTLGCFHGTNAVTPSGPN